MSDRSIRSFALDYYRKRGADVRPLAGDDAEAFEITQADGAALKVTFAEEVPQAATGPQALTATSPQWRAILEDLTADVAVSYRYMASQPIANPARTLTAALPEGWAVDAARLLKVDNRLAVGFTYRVTFDSPALNARREVMHHHLWDAETGKRLESLEPELYQAPTIMIKPSRFPDEATVKALLDRTLALVDADTDARGVAIESELKQQLSEVETRTNQYFEQQMGHALQREALLVEKYETTLKRLAEARTEELALRYRQEASALQGQIAHARAMREQTLQGIESACTTKLAQEAERHELTAMTDLVAVCHASYDVLSYKALVVPPGGAPVNLELRYWPTTKELVLQDCPRCAGAMTAPRVLADGAIACGRCAQACGGCGAVGAEAKTAGACKACAIAVCGACEAACTACGHAACAAHTTTCSACDGALCTGCAATCATCDAALCGPHAHVDPTTGRFHCREHKVAIAPEDAIGAAIVVAPPAPVEPEALSAQTPEQLDEAPLPEPAPTPTRTSPLVAFTAAILGKHARTTAALQADAAAVDVDVEAEVAPAIDPESSLRAALPETAPYMAVRAAVDGDAHQDQAFAALFAAPAPQVVSGLSGRALPASHADTCPACGGHFAVSEMVDCATCGVPACAKCAHGELAPCPGCVSLTPTVAHDPRLAFVMDTFPDLAQGKRAWEVAQVGPYVVTHWSRWGAWGMVVYHRGGNGQDPVVLTEFRYGRMAALGQALNITRGRA